MQGSPYPQLQGLGQSMGGRIPKLRAHANARESVSPIQGTTTMRRSPYPELEGPCNKMGVRIPNPKEPPQKVGVHIPNSRGHTKT